MTKPKLIILTAVISLSMTTITPKPEPTTPAEEKAQTAYKGQMQTYTQESLARIKSSIGEIQERLTQPFTFNSSAQKLGYYDEQNGTVSLVFTDVSIHNTSAGVYWAPEGGYHGKSVQFGSMKNPNWKPQPKGMVGGPQYSWAMWGIPAANNVAGTANVTFDSSALQYAQYDSANQIAYLTFTDVKSLMGSNATGLGVLIGTIPNPNYAPNRPGVYAGVEGTLNSNLYLYGTPSTTPVIEPTPEPTSKKHTKIHGQKKHHKKSNSTNSNDITVDLTMSGVDPKMVPSIAVDGNHLWISPKHTAPGAGPNDLSRRFTIPNTSKTITITLEHVRLLNEPAPALAR